MANSYSPTVLINQMFTEFTADTRFFETPILDALAGSAIQQPQHEINWAARLTDAASSGRALLAALTDDTRGSLGAASLTIPDYYAKHQMLVEKRDLVEAASSGRVDLVRNLTRTQIDDAMRSIALSLETAIFNGVGTLNNTSFGIFGMVEVARQTLTYAGISKTAVPRWRPIVGAGAVPGTPSALTVDRFTATMRLRRAAGATYMRNDGSSLLAVTSPIIQDDVLRKLYAAETTLNADYGRFVADINPFVGYQVQGIPVVTSLDSWNTNRITLLDLSKWGIHQFADAAPAAQNDDNIRFFKFKNLQFRIAEVNRDHPDFFTFEITVGMQLRCYDPIQGITLINDVSNSI